MKHQTLLHGLLQMYIRKTQKQYFDHIRDKIADLRSQLASRPHDKALCYLINIMTVSIAGPGEKSVADFAHPACQQWQGNVVSSDFVNEAFWKVQIEKFEKFHLERNPIFAGVQRALLELSESDA